MVEQQLAHNELLECSHGDRAAHYGIRALEIVCGRKDVASKSATERIGQVHPRRELQGPDRRVAEKSGELFTHRLVGDADPEACSTTARPSPEIALWR